MIWKDSLFCVKFSVLLITDVEVHGCSGLWNSHLFLHYLFLVLRWLCCRAPHVMGMLVLNKTISFTVPCCLCFRVMNAEDVAHYLYHGGHQLRVFCSDSCVNVFILSARKIVICEACKVCIWKSFVPVNSCCLQLFFTTHHTTAGKHCILI